LFDTCWNIERKWRGKCREWEKKIGKEVIENGRNKYKQSREKERRKKFGMIKETGNK
jgi:hypothetical protein